MQTRTDNMPVMENEGEPHRTDSGITGAKKDQ